MFPVTPHLLFIGFIPFSKDFFILFQLLFAWADFRFPVPVMTGFGLPAGIHNA
jgi:hypothetical protein